MLQITPTEHEKSEWSRMARAAYAAGKNSVGHRYSMSAAYCVGQSMPLQKFDDLQNGYRDWLCFSKWPEVARQQYQPDDDADHDERQYAEPML
jgi:predicted methyltransferase